MARGRYGWKAWGLALAVALAAASCAPEPRTPASAQPTPRSDAHAAQRHAEINALPAREDIALVFLGDSISERWESDGRYAWNRHYEPRRAANFGVAGDRSEHVLWRIEHGNFAGLQPRLVVLLIGTNNLLVHEDAEVAAGVVAVVDRLRAKLPGTRILLLGILPRGARPDDPMRARIRAINASLAAFQQGSGLRFLDAGPALLEADGRLGREIAPDFLHLSPRGYRRLAEAIEPEIARGLGAERIAPE
jgi:lysophospholipase L1-like esterase